MVLRFLVAGIFAVTVSASTGFAHGGGVDGNGGHTNKATGDYHCHRAGCVDHDGDPTGEAGSEPEGSDESLLWPDGPDDDSITVAGSWGTAKKWARDTIYAGHKTTLYCGCGYTDRGTSGGEISKASRKSCGYDDGGESYKSLADDMEWEHVVPASLMPARGFACWTTGLENCAEPGRACCERQDLNARVMIFDLHNLVPSVGQTNRLRSNKRYGLIEGEDLKLGSCDFEWTDDLTEPAAVKRGELARIWLYMRSRHGVVLAPGELEMYMRWSVQDSPQLWEFTRNQRI